MTRSPKSLLLFVFFFFFFNFPFLKCERCSSSLSLPCSVLIIDLTDTSRNHPCRHFQMPGELWGYRSSHKPLSSPEEMGPTGEQREQRRRHSGAFTDCSCSLRTMETGLSAFRKNAGNTVSLVIVCQTRVGAHIWQYIQTCRFVSSLWSVTWFPVLDFLPALRAKPSDTELAQAGHDWWELILSADTQ